MRSPTGGSGSPEHDQPQEKEVKEMTLAEQLEKVKTEYPEAWKYLNESKEIRLPKFDENDEIISSEEMEGEK